MSDLTGGVTYTRNLRDKDVGEMIQEGGLWRELQQVHKEGSLIACSRNVRGEAPSADTPLGILSNHAYAILQVKSLPDSGHRMLLVRDPWGKGAFSGQWRASSDVWQVYPAAKQHLRPAPEEGSGKFWMTFEEFVDTMTTVHFCRVFPAHYHSLAVRSEWSKVSAGGPPTSHTWFLNPQFRISVANTASVVISVVQLDHRIPGRTHAPVLCGIVVLRAPKGTQPVRMWLPSEENIVAMQHAIPGREVSISVKLSHGSLYYIVPFTSSADMQAPFMLRCYSASLIELQRVPPPSESSARGQWIAHYAGGRRPAASWAKNPQFALSTTHHDEDIMLLLATEHDASSNGDDAQQQQEYVPGASVGMCLVKSNDSQRVRAVEDHDVELEDGFTDPRHAVILYRCVRA
jgi:hypothetical protein